jgi:hypothetical protein
VTRRIATLWTHSPRTVLVVCALAVIVLSAYAVGVPDRLDLRDGSVAGSQSERAAEALAAELGYDPEPAFVLVLAATEPVGSAAGEVAINTTRAQIEEIEGVVAVREQGRSADGSTAALAVHLARDADADTEADVEAALLGGLDAGPYRLLLGGSVPTAEGARDTILDEAPALELIALPLLLLVLGAALGPWLGLATLLGAVLALSATWALVGLLGELVGLEAISTAAAAPVAVVLAVEAAAALLYRYREESASLGGGSEALEFSLRTVLRGAAIGMFSAALVGAALCAIPVGAVQSVGVGVIVAALLAPPLALPPVAAALSMRAGEEIGEALPLASDWDATAAAPAGYRALFGLGHARRRALLALTPLIVVVVAALPLLDAEAIGLDAAELPAAQSAAAADAELSGAFGTGAGGPITVVAASAPEAELSAYRSAISSLSGVASVGLAASAGELDHFDVIPASRPRSLAAQQEVGTIATVPAPSPTAITGPAATVRDAALRLGDDLPLVLLVALLGTAALWSALFRSAFGPLLALVAVAAPLIGLGSMAWVFGDGRLDGPLGYAPAGAPHLGSFVVVGAVLLATALWRSAQTASALHEERDLGGGAAGSLARSGLLTLMPAAIATLAGLVTIGVWLGAPLTAAKEVALGLSAGLLADLLLTRMLLAPAVARLSLRGEE